MVRCVPLRKVASKWLLLLRNDAEAAKTALAGLRCRFRNGIDKQNFLSVLLDAEFAARLAREERTEHVLGACLPPRETNSARPRYNLRRDRAGVEGSRRRKSGRVRDGWMSERARHSVASRGRRRWTPDHSRALRKQAAAVARIGRCRRRLAIDRYGPLPLVAEKSAQEAAESDQAQAQERVVIRAQVPIAIEFSSRKPEDMRG